LKVSCRCGLRPNTRQIREITVCDIPLAAAIDRVDQCVASAGEDSSVVTIPRSTWSSVIVRGRPGLGSSNNPSRRSSMNRARHLVTVLRETLNSAATRVFAAPSAQASTIRDRNANAWDVFRRRVQPSKVWPSSAVNSNGASFGRT
jgi:hypothetical protein